MRMCEHGNLYCDSIICGGDGLPWETVETQMRRIVYETNIGRWPYMTRKWPAKQRIKTVDYLAHRLSQLRSRRNIHAVHTYQVWNANVTDVELTPFDPSGETQMGRTDPPTVRL